MLNMRTKMIVSIGIHESLSLLDFIGHTLVPHANAMTVAAMTEMTGVALEACPRMARD